MDYYDDVLNVINGFPNGFFESDRKEVIANIYQKLNESNQKQVINTAFILLVKQNSNITGKLPICTDFVRQIACWETQTPKCGKYPTPSKASKKTSQKTEERSQQKMEITAQEIINTIESRIIGTIPDKHACIKGVLQSKEFLDHKMSLKEIVRLMEWQEK